MLIIDSHCHIQFPQYDEDREEVIKRTLEEGVFVITVGSNLENSIKAVELVKNYPGKIWATIGLHPDDIDEHYDISLYHKILEETGNEVIAVGEVGLDYYQTPEEEKREKQKKVFRNFIDLAIEFNKPLVLHTRSEKDGKSVHEDIIEILKPKIKNLKLSGVVHSFTGSIEEAGKYLEIGFYIGLNGIVTFEPKKSRPGYDDLIRFLPLDKILLETDAPWLSPEPFRGQRNEPARVTEVAKKVAEVKDLSLGEVVKQTTENCQNLFKILI